MNSQEILSRMSCFSLQDRGCSIWNLYEYTFFNRYLPYRILQIGAQAAKPERGNEFEDGIIFEVNDMTPNDFAKRIQNYHDEVIRAWQEDQRVKAIKIVIQV